MVTRTAGKVKECYAAAMWRLLVSVVLLVACVGGAGYWLTVHETYRVLEVSAPHDVPELGLPVYAQFEVTQTLVLREVHRVTAVELPIFAPSDSTAALTVVLTRNGHPVADWHYVPSVHGITTAVLPLSTPALLDGDLALHLADPTTLATAADDAIRIFVESADTHYPEGHYRIAANDKQGDVGFTLYGERTRLASYFERWRQRPYDTSARLLVVVAGWILIGAMPWLWSRQSQHLPLAQTKH